MWREHGEAKESSTAAPKPHTDQAQQQNHEAEEHARSDHRWAALAAVPKRKRAPTRGSGSSLQSPAASITHSHCPKGL